MWNWLLKLLQHPASKPDAEPVPDAPDVLFSRPATWEDIIATARLLNRHRVRYLLVGGYALAAHGYVRMTEDIDIAVAPEPENSRRWVLAQRDDEESKRCCLSTQGGSEFDAREDARSRLREQHAFRSLGQLRNALARGVLAPIQKWAIKTVSDPKKLKEELSKLFDALH